MGTLFVFLLLIRNGFFIWSWELSWKLQVCLCPEGFKIFFLDLTVRANSQSGSTRKGFWHQTGLLFQLYVKTSGCKSCASNGTQFQFFLLRQLRGDSLCWGAWLLSVGQARERVSIHVAAQRVSVRVLLFMKWCQLTDNGFKLPFLSKMQMFKYYYSENWLWEMDRSSTQVVR